MSDVTSTLGRSRNCFQVHETSSPTRPTHRKVQVCLSPRGASPYVRTGHFCVITCPGGRRSRASVRFILRRERESISLQHLSERPSPPVGHDRRPSFSQHLVYEGDRILSLPDCRRDTFEIACPDVAHREHSRQARFEEMRSPGERPVRGGQVVLRQVRPRLDEPLPVERYTTVEPVC